MNRPHHRSIRLKTRVVHYGLLPLTLLIVPAWIYGTYGFCGEAESAQRMEACRLLRAGPFASVLIGVVALALVAWDLAWIGRELHGGEKVAGLPGIHHAAHGYRKLDSRHRSHIHWAIIQLIVTAAGVAFWIAYKSHQADY
jgi:hypothetical protein